MQKTTTTDVLDALRVIAEHNPEAAAAWEAFTLAYAEGHGRVDLLIMACETTPMEQWDWGMLAAWAALKLPASAR